MPVSVLTAIGVQKALGFAQGDPKSALTAAILGGPQGLSIASLFYRPKGPQQPSFAQELSARGITVRQPISYRQGIYGEPQFGGVLTFAEVSADQAYLHLIVTWSGHELAELGDLYLDDQLVPLDGSGLATSGPYNKGATQNHVEAFIVPWTPTGAVDVAHTVQSVNSVSITYPVGDTAATETVALVDVSPNTPELFNQYKRSGTTFTFAPNPFGTAAWHSGASLSIDYEESVTTSWIRVQDSLGGEDSATQPFPDLVSESAGLWTSAHKQVGCAKSYFRFEYSPEAFPNGIPNIKRQGKGKKPIEWRASPTERAYSANWGLCVADFLTDSVLGLGAATSELDMAELAAAANTSDEDVALPGSPTETENRYELHGIFSSDQTPREILGRMMTAARGNVRYIGGLWLVQPGAWRAPTGDTLTTDDLRGPVKVMPRISRRELSNTVKGIYRGPLSNWQPTDFPPASSAAYLAQDQGEELAKQIDMPFSKSPYACQRVANIELEASRQQSRIQWPGKLTCYQYQPGNVVPITLSRFGLTAALYEVESVSLVREGGAAIGCDLLLRKTAATVFDDVPASLVTAAPETNLPSPFDADAPIDLVFDQADWQLTGEGELSWTAVGPYNAAFEVQYKRKGDARWKPVPVVAGSETAKRFTGLQPGPYRFRARSVNQLGVRSAWSDILDQTLTPPAVPNINGLRLRNATGTAGSSSHIFTGRDAKFEWRAVSTQLSYDIGSEPVGTDVGAGSGAAGQGDVDPFFKDYKIEVWDVDATTRAETAEQPVRPAEFRTTPEYAYTWEKNAEDHGGTPVRIAKLKVWGRDKFGNESPRAAQFTFKINPPALSESSITLVGVTAGFSYALTMPGAGANMGVKVYASTTSGFTPSGSTLVKNLRFKHGEVVADQTLGLPAGLTVYVKFIPYDVYGDGTTSSEFSVTTEVLQDDGGLGAGDRDGIVTLKTSKAIATIFGASDYIYNKSAPPVWVPSTQHLLLNGVGAASVYLAALNPRGLAVSKAVTLAAPFTFPDGTSQLVYLPSLGKVYMLLSDVLGVADPKIYEINPATLAVTNTWTLTGKAAELLVMGCGSPRDGTLLLLASGGRKIYTFDPSGGTLSSAFNLGASAGCYIAAYFPSFDKFAILSTVAADRSVYFVDRGLTAFTQYTPGGAITPTGLAYSALGDRLWVYCDDQNFYLIKRDGTLDTTVASPSALYDGRLMTSKSSGLLAQYIADGLLPGDKVLTFSPITKSVVSAGVSIGNGLVLFWSPLCWIPPVDRAAAVYFDSGGFAAARLGSFTL